MSDAVQLAANNATRVWAARRGVNSLKVMFARHLRDDHGLSQRAVAQRLGETVRWVREEVDGR